MWYKERVFYQLYTLNFCGAPSENNGELAHRLHKIDPFIDYLADLGIGAIYFNPVFSSDRHGYDTRDYRKIDERLGTNEEFKDLVERLHEQDIKVVLDGVFNHVGRGFFAFKDVQEKKWDSPYKDWFRIDFNGNSPYNDGFWYEGWEGHYELVKLNLENPAVQDYLKDAIRYWIEYFGIDGIRLDVSYLLPRWFMAMITDFAKSIKPDFFMLGEVLGDNAGYLFNEGHLDCITDYPSYKGFWSSFNSLNLFEIAHTLKRNMFDMYRGRILLSFLDNHDVDRIASKLTDLNKLPLLFGLQMALPGVPCIYYGSEWGQKGVKIPGKPDDDLRPSFDEPLPNELTKAIKRMIHVRNNYPALSVGEMRELRLMNQQYVFERYVNDQRIIVALNIAEQEVDFPFNANASKGIDLLTGKEHDFSDQTLTPLSIHYYLVID